MYKPDVLNRKNVSSSVVSKLDVAASGSCKAASGDAPGELSAFPSNSWLKSSKYSLLLQMLWLLHGMTGAQLCSMHS